MTGLGKIAVVFTLMWFVSAGAVDPASPVAGKKQTVDVLIVTGIDHPAHKWRQTAAVLAEVLEKDPRMQVRIVEDPHFLDSSALHRYDVVVLHFMNWEKP